VSTFGQVVTSPQVTSSANAFTYLVTPRFKLSNDMMVYARFASGYRAGGPNPTPGGVVPKQYDPDKTLNYELGAKGDFLDHAVSFDASLYYIKWDDIQITLVNQQDGVSSYQVNGGHAKSEGVELSAEVRPAKGLTLSAWAVLNNPVLTENFPPASIVAGTGVDGAKLPFASRFSAHVSAQQAFPIHGDLSGYLGGMLSYVGERDGGFVAVAPRQVYPAYAKLDLRAGFDYATWTLNLYADNVTDRRGMLSGGIGQFPPFAFNYIQPRTIGLNIAKSF